MSTLSRPVVALLGAGAIANTGIRVAGVAIPWFVLTSTGSAAQTGLVLAFEMAPYVVSKTLSGPVLDRIGQRRISIWSDVVGALLFGLIPLLHQLDRLSFPVLLLLVALGGAVRAPGDNAKHTSVPLVAELAGAPLPRITGLYGAVERGSGLVAPGLAAVMISFWSASGTIVITAICFGLCAVAWLLVMPSGLGRVATTERERPSFAGYRRELIEGFRFLLGEKLVLTLVLMIAFTNLLDIAKAAVLLPVWATRSGQGVAAIGILLTCFAAASTVSSLLASWIGDRMPRRLTYFVAFMIAGPPPFIALGLDLPLWAIGIVYGVGGFAAGFLNPMIGAMFFERIPQPLLGRVGGLADSVAWAGIPFGGLVAAGLIAATGLTPALFLCGAAYAVATLLPALAGRHSFDAPAADDSTTDETAGDAQPSTSQVRPSKSSRAASR